MDVTTTFLRLTWLGEELEALRLKQQELTGVSFFTPDWQDIARRNWNVVLNDVRLRKIVTLGMLEGMHWFLYKLEKEMQTAVTYQTMKLRDLTQSPGLPDPSDITSEDQLLSELACLDAIAFVSHYDKWVMEGEQRRLSEF